MSLLDVADLSVDFPTRRGRAARAGPRLAVSIDPGEILGVVGESGAGKSLTGAAIIGLLEPPGRVVRRLRCSLEGRRIDRLMPDQMRRGPRPPDRRGVPGPADHAEPALHRRPPVGGNDADPSGPVRPGREAPGRCKWLVDVGIPGAAERVEAYPHEFSGGMRQRVVIALALCAPSPSW